MNTKQLLRAAAEKALEGGYVPELLESFNAREDVQRRAQAAFSNIAVQAESPENRCMILLLAAEAL